MHVWITAKVKVNRRLGNAGERRAKSSNKHKSGRCGNSQHLWIGARFHFRLFSMGMIHRMVQLACCMHPIDSGRTLVNFIYLYCKVCVIYVVSSTYSARMHLLFTAAHIQMHGIFSRFIHFRISSHVFAGFFFAVSFWRDNLAKNWQRHHRRRHQTDRIECQRSLRMHFLIVSVFLFMFSHKLKLKWSDASIG